MQRKKAFEELRKQKQLAGKSWDNTTVKHSSDDSRRGTGAVGTSLQLQRPQLPRGVEGGVFHTILITLGPHCHLPHVRPDTSDQLDLRRKHRDRGQPLNVAIVLRSVDEKQRT
jgi:hypothetical protein